MTTESHQESMGAAIEKFSAESSAQRNGAKLAALLQMGWAVKPSIGFMLRKPRIAFYMWRIRRLLIAAKRKAA